jgi:DMSO reductase anchor subunit
VKPALSVVLFTVSSGAGFGLMVLLALTDLAAGGRFAPALPFVAGGLVALALVGAGLLSSTLHLANPRNARYAFTRFRTSWLSREGVFALVFFAFAVAYLASVWLGAAAAPRIALALATIALAWATLYSQAMIYASLKPIRQWHTPITPLNYFAHGHASGALAWLATLYAAGRGPEPHAWIALALVALSLFAKLAYFGRLSGGAGSRTLAEAIGASRMRARLFDLGHSHGTFLTDEFGFRESPARARLLRLALYAGAWALPALWILAGVPSVAGAVIAFLACLAGLLCERWLFFAEARHTVRLYHGDART